MHPRVTVAGKTTSAISLHSNYEPFTAVVTALRQLQRLLTRSTMKLVSRSERMRNGMRFA